MRYIREFRIFSGPTKLDFDWDPAKAASNELKHKVQFQTALEAFADFNRVDFDVTRQGDGEVRRKIVGKVEGRLLALVYTVRSGRTRIISARPANIQEIRRYDDR